MKKLATILLAIAMIFAMCIPAFAADTANLTINGLDGRVYDGYKLLDLSVSHKADVNCGGNHDSDTCYNYSYTVVNASYRTILQNEVFANGTTTAAAATDVTDDEIIAYLAAQASGDYASLRAVADRIYTAIKADSNINPDEEEFDGSATIEQGYWLFADVTNLAGQDAANSFVMVDTKGEIDLEITPKTALPTIKKEVYDVNDSDVDNEDLNGWGDYADHDIGDDVQFKLTATLADNFSYYDTYKLVFHDDLADGLTLDPDSIQVVAKNGNATVDLTGKYNVDTETDHCDFEVTFDDVTDITGVTKDTVFEVTYTATLNEYAVVGAVGNTNDVKLVYSNDPYSASMGETSDSVKVYTYKLVIDKIDAVSQAALSGATFELSKKNADGDYELVNNAVVLSNNSATFTWTGLDDGEYKLEEIAAPAGYNKLTAPIEFTISAEHTENTFALTSTFGTVGTENAIAQGTITEEIENSTGTILPETGAMGTTLLIAGGVILMMIAGVFMITRKKMSVYED